MSQERRGGADRRRRDDARGAGRGQGREGDRQRDARGRERSGARGQGGPRRGYSVARPSERSRRSTPSRQVAFEGLRLVREEDSYANLVLPRLLRSHRVSGRDAEIGRAHV